MPLVISGKLSLPVTGRPAANAEIRFRAVNSVGEIIQGAESLDRCDASGNYNISLEFARYELATKISTVDFIVHGQVTIDIDTIAADLESLIEQIGLAGELTDELIKEFQQLKAETVAAASEAKQSASSAAADAKTASDAQIAITPMYNYFNANYPTFETNYQDFAVKYPDVVQKHAEVVTLEGQTQAAKDLAEKWASNPEDVPVTGSEYSAFHWAEKARQNANQTFVSGGLFTPAAGNEYPDVSGVSRDTIWIMEFSTHGETYTFTSGQLSGKVTGNGDMLFYDASNNTWNLIPTAVAAGIISVDGNTGPNVNLESKYYWSGNKPAVSDVTGLQSELDSKTDEAHVKSEIRSRTGIYKVGNISAHVGEVLTEAEKLNSYQYPDNSGDWYGPIQSQVFPITIPANPTVPGSGWSLVNGLTSDQVISLFESGAVDISHLGVDSDNRDYIYGLNSNVYVKLGESVRCNLLPDDDVTIFKGQGIIVTTDAWGNEHIFNVDKANKGSEFTTTQLTSQALGFWNGNLSIGVIGDSVTDGANSDGWVENPTSQDGNLSSLNYDHNKNGGKNSWFAKYGNNLHELTENRIYKPFKMYNAASSGKRLSDGWAYRNFDYGFFQNSAYENKAPDILIVAMGINDQITSQSDYSLYLEQYRKIITKAWGYGCAVMFVTLNDSAYPWWVKELAVKKSISDQLNSIEYFNLAKALNVASTQASNPNMGDLWKKSNGSWDTTHPRDDGHNLMAGQLIYDQLSGDLGFNSGSLFMPFTDRYAKCFSVTNGNYLYQMQSVSGAYLNDFGGWPKVNFSDDIEGVIRYPVYVTDEDSAYCLFFPLENGYSSGYPEGLNHNLKVYRGSVGVDSLYIDEQIPVELESEYTTIMIEGMTKGLNWVDLTLRHSPRSVWIPALTKNLQSNSSVNNVVRVVSSIDGVVTTEKPLLLQDLTNRSVLGEIPDFHYNISYSFSTSARVRVSVDLTGVLFSFKRTLRGIAVIRNGSKVSIRSVVSGVVTSTVLGEIFVDCSSGEWVAVSQRSPNGSVISIFNSSGDQGEFEVAGSFGGAVGFANASGGNKKMMVDFSTI